jgi:uncharacterized iron-regulated membrane protein
MHGPSGLTRRFDKKGVRAMHRSDFLVWHRRLAMLFAPLILLQALTGAVLLFREPLGRLLEVVPATGTVQPVDRLYAAAAATGKQVQRIHMPPEPGRTALVQLADASGQRSLAMIDPVSARIVRQGGLAQFPIEAALQLHYRLMAGTTGMVVIGLSGIVLLFMAGTGLAFWWPRKGRMRQSLAINPRMPSRVKLRHWHRSVGVVATVLIVASAATGALIAGNDAIAAIFAAAPAGKVEPRPEPRSAPRPAPDAQSVAAGLQLAQALFPRAAVRDIRFAPGARMDVNLLAPERNALAVHVVTVDLAAMRIAKVMAAQDNPALWMKILPYHSGDEFGLAGRLVLLVEALVLIGLGVSGPLMWWQQRKLRK